VANRTKWAEFFDEVVAAKLVPLEIKLIDSDVSARSTWVICPVRGYVEASAIGPVTFRWIEWVRSERIEEITTLAKRVGLEWRVDDERATVFGYR
jgi:hypothetical protein